IINLWLSMMSHHHKGFFCANLYGNHIPRARRLDSLDLLDFVVGWTLHLLSCSCMLLLSPKSLSARLYVALVACLAYLLAYSHRCWQLALYAPLRSHARTRTH